jgi:hypothetical protein
VVVAGGRAAAPRLAQLIGTFIAGL